MATTEPAQRVGADLIPKVAVCVKTYMSHFDGSHDFSHIKRVIGNAHLIITTLRDPSSPHYLPASLLYNEDTITLSALLHDVGDRKYLKSGEIAETMVRDILLDFGASKELAEIVQEIVLGVSWTSEMKDPQRVVGLIKQYPELAVVQDADRLDSIGAVGIGRVFMFGGAKTERGLDSCVDLFEGKLLRLQGGMKTGVGREMAALRTGRLRRFEGWWGEEWGVEGIGAKVLGDSGVGMDVIEVKREEGEGIVVGGMERVRMEIESEMRGRLEKELRAKLRTEIELELRKSTESEPKETLEKELKPKSQTELMDEWKSEFIGKLEKDLSAVRLI